jgi:DNA-directed RNA polymerase I subunit RPA1
MKKSGINPEKDALEEHSEYKADKKKKAENNRDTTQDSAEDSGSESEVIEEKKIDDNNFKYLHHLEVREHMKKLWDKESPVLSIIFGNVFPNKEKGLEVQSCGADMFFLDNIIVAPNRFRPENKSEGGGMYLHLQSVLLTKIINLNNNIVEISMHLKGEGSNKNENTETPNKEASNEKDKSNKKKAQKNSETEKVEENKEHPHLTSKDLVIKWTELQETVNVLYDSQKSSKKEKKEGTGIRQILEKKEGMFRMKMMGKRVNYAGRSVISADPMISANEVGVPLYIASKLTYPEPVTKFNIDRLKQFVINGPKIYPGANLIENENGTKVALEMIKNEEYRKKIADKLEIGKNIVYRHLMTGDILLVNRQPTLHKPSIMSHKAKVLPGEKTIRLHYSNCNSYNADFDGDEMNIHLLQNHIARQEAYTISNTDNQYIVPTSGKPLKGLIQDSIVSAVFLTLKDTFLTKEEYFQIVYAALDAPLNNGTIRKIALQHPAMIKPKQFWTGKQVITTILKSLITSKKVENIADCTGINMDHNTKLSNNIWGKEHALESTVTVRDNELLTGVLDKNHIGNSDYGIIHSFYEIYGAEMAGELISTFGRLFIVYLQYYHGFTCGVDDLVLKEEFNFKRRMDIENTLKSGLVGLSKYFKMDDFNLDFDNFSRRSVYTRKTAQNIMNYKLTPVERDDIESLIDLQNTKVEECFTVNNEHNAKIISELRDRYNEAILKDESADSQIDITVKNAINKLVSQHNDNWLSKGLVKKFPKNLFSTMVLTGAKGSLVNHSQISCMLGQQELEGKRVPRMASGRTLPSFEPFDPNPRAGGFITDRFLTGVRPQEFFFHCMAGREGLIDTAVKTSRSGYLQRCLVKHLEQLVVGYDYTVRDTDNNIVQFLYGEDSIDPMNTKFLTKFNFLAKNLDIYESKYKPDCIKGKIDTKTLRKGKKALSKNETLLSNYPPWLYLGSVSDTVYSAMTDYIENNKKNIEDVGRFKNTVYFKYLNSLIQPGESVGILAAQSVGEPSTQMTLNTFHLAGHGGVNMTLGIPRLREILMTSENNIKTPIMVVPFFSTDKEFVKIFARSFEKYNLVDIVKEIGIKRNIVIANGVKARQYSIDIQLEDLKQIKDYFRVDSKTVKKILKLNFIPFLAGKISKLVKQKHKDIIQTLHKTQLSNTNMDVEGEGKEEPEENEGGKNKNDENEDEKSGDESEAKENDQDDEYYNNLQSVDEDDTLEKLSQGEEVLNEEEVVGEVADEDAMEVDEESQDKKKEEYNVKSQIYEFVEGKMEKILFSKSGSNFSFQLFLPYTQKCLLLKNILDQALKQTKFKSINGVKNCRILEKTVNDNIVYNLQLEGINFYEVMKYSDYLDTKKIYTNDIGSFLRIYGIEACRASIVKEINNVFGSYHISVDNRHLGLIADYITYQGTYRSFNRVGMEVKIF